MRARAAGTAEAPPAELWPAIRDRIEMTKIVALPAAVGNPVARRARVRRSILWTAVAAAGIAIFAVGRASGRLGGAPAPAGDAGVNPPSVNVADSSNVYEQEARTLFNRLALERSLVRPEALASIERDLHVVDSAIAELDAAVARDPKNPVLRRLLASSYRQKVGILRRVANAE
jgi:hypothetical protein